MLREKFESTGLLLMGARPAFHYFPTWHFLTTSSISWILLLIIKTAYDLWGPMEPRVKSGLKPCT